MPSLGPWSGIVTSERPRRRFAWRRSAWQLWSLIVVLLAAAFVLTLYLGPRSQTPEELPSLPVKPVAPQG